MNVDAELAWTRELVKRQEAHTLAAYELLHALKAAGPVKLTYSLCATQGSIIDLNRDLVALDIGEGTRWITLLQITHVNGTELPTSRRFERPPVDGVQEMRIV